jgi:hypothetical protein
MGFLKSYAGYGYGDGGRLTHSAPFIIVHNIEHVRRALRVAASLKCPTFLLSTPDAAGTIGPAVFRDMIDISIKETDLDPDQVFAFIDCGSNAGHALKAVQEKCRHIRINASSEILVKLRDMLGSDSRVIDAVPISTLDLEDTSISDEAILNWLNT